MRIPLPIVLVLALSVIGGTWWMTTRKMDFLTPPSEQKLAMIRAHVEEANAKPQRSGDPVQLPSLKTPDPNVPPPTAEEKPPSIELGDLDSPPTLEAYSERALDGPDKLAELAELLEKEGEFQRALLAWERSLDVTKPNTSEVSKAVTAIRRLRPTLPDWNSDPNAAIPVVLHAGTGPTLADTMRPALEDAAKELTRASAGILKVTAVLAVGKRSPTKGPIPAALWLSGPTKESVSTDVLSFTLGPKEVLKDEIHKIAFQLISGQLKRLPQFTPPADILQGESPLEALQSNITRLSWREFGQALNAAQ